jgi:hypothetical protein
MYELSFTLIGRVEVEQYIYEWEDSLNSIGFKALDESAVSK